MERENRFKIVFEKLEESLRAQEHSNDPDGAPTIEFVSPDEIDEIDELRRLSLELSEPESKYFTST
jgi:hypothetical protein